MNKLNETTGAIVRHEQEHSGFTASDGSHELKIRFYSPAIARIQFGKSDLNYTRHSYAVVAEPADIELKCTESAGYFELKTEALNIQITKAAMRLSFFDKNAKLLSAEDKAFGTSWLGTEVTCYRQFMPNERFIGLGEKTGNLDRKGSAYTNWNTDYFAYPVEADPIYASIPFFIGIHDSGMYGIFLDNCHKTHFNFGASTDRFSYFSAEDGEMNYYFISGDSIQEIVAGYTQLCGTMKLPPKWSLGFQQCRYSYYPDTEVRRIAQTFREKQIPADVIYLDIHYMQAYKVFSWDQERFPQPKKLCDELGEMGFKLAVILDPGIKVEDDYAPFKEAKEQKLFVQFPDGTDYKAQVWPGWCHFPDFTKPECRKWWGEQLKELVQSGVRGFWNDMNEPASWGQFVPNLIEFDFEGEKTSHHEARNVYGMQMSRSTDEGVAGHLENERHFTLTRAAFSGIQRYAAVWTGDNQASDEHMLLAVRLVNSLGLSGVAFAGCDVGGFCGDTSENLFARWISIGAFSPFFRAHKMINSKSAEPWSYGEEVEAIARNYIGLRYRLMPHLYSAFYQASKSGLPVQRSLVFDYARDPEIYKPEFQNQFFFGEGLMVCPVSSSSLISKVYLPEGEWYTFFSDEKYHGGQTILVESPLDRLPIFVKSGSIIAMQSLVQNMEEAHDGCLRLHIYHGNENSSTEVYDDDGKTYNYRSGRFSLKKVSYNGANNTIEIIKQCDSTASAFNKIALCLHGFSELEQVKLNGKPIQVEQRTTRLLEPLPDFDPLGKEYSSAADLAVQYVEFDADEDVKVEM